MDEFHKNKSRPDGLCHVCKLCRKAYSKANSEHIKSISKRWRQDNLEYCREVSRQYGQNKPHIKNAIKAQRRASKKKATLKGFDAEIKKIYSKCKELQKNCAEKLVVDHIIPLQHPDVCGLHVPWNLQIISESENLCKKNSFDGTYTNESWKIKIS